MMSTEERTYARVAGELTSITDTLEDCKLVPFASARLACRLREEERRLRRELWQISKKDAYLTAE